MAEPDKRDFVSHMYARSSNWQRRVAAMSDSQVFAIYMREKRKQEEKDEQVKAAARKRNRDRALGRTPEPPADADELPF